MWKFYEGDVRGAQSILTGRCGPGLGVWDSLLEEMTCGWDLKGWSVEINQELGEGFLGRRTSWCRGFTSGAHVHCYRLSPACSRLSGERKGQIRASIPPVVVQLLRLCPTLQPHGLQHTRLPCPSPSPRGCSDVCPFSWGCYLTISYLSHRS